MTLKSTSATGHQTSSFQVYYHDGTTFSLVSSSSPTAALILAGSIQPQLAKYISITSGSRLRLATSECTSSSNIGSTTSFSDSSTNNSASTFWHGSTNQLLPIKWRFDFLKINGDLPYGVATSLWWIFLLPWDSRASKDMFYGLHLQGRGFTVVAISTLGGYDQYLRWFMYILLNKLERQLCKIRHSTLLFRTLDS